MSTEVSRVSVQVGREEITFETGKLAKQASGAVVVTQGETMVLATATAGNVSDAASIPDPHYPSGTLFHAGDSTRPAATLARNSFRVI